MLLIDAGNTRVKLCSWQPGQLGEPQGLDQTGTALRTFAHSTALVSCVATPQRSAQLKQHLDEHKIKAHWLKSPKQGLGIHNAYANAELWGVDRWLALAAAYAACQQPCCVIDVGTAITVDICGEQGQHLGGLIAPGLKPLRQALQQQTSLPEINQNDRTMSQANWLAQNTLDALHSGAMQSACGLIERSIRLAQEQHACDNVFLTGGDALSVQPHLQSKVSLIEDLVFQGLGLYAQEISTQANDPL